MVTGSRQRRHGHANIARSINGGCNAELTDAPLGALRAENVSGDGARAAEFREGGSTPVVGRTWVDLRALVSRSGIPCSGASHSGASRGRRPRIAPYRDVSMTAAMVDPGKLLTVTQ